MRYLSPDRPPVQEDRRPIECRPMVAAPVRRDVNVTPAMWGSTWMSIPATRA